MSDRIHHDPALRVWIEPTDPGDMLPLPALLHSETEHEVIVSEYNRRKQCFELAERERRTTAHRDFEACRVAMLQRQSAVLELAREEARNQASIYQHILSVPPQPFPNDKADEFLTPPAKVQEEEGQEKAVQEEVKPTARPRRRRR